MRARSRAGRRRGSAGLPAGRVFLDDFVNPVWRLAEYRRKGVDEIANRFSQSGLIVLDRQEIVGLSITNDLRRVGLRAHGVDGDEAALQGQDRQPFGDGRLLVFIFRQSSDPLTDPTQEGRSEFVGIPRREHSAKRIVAGNALLQSLSRNRNEGIRFHAAACKGLIWKPSAAARRLRAAMLRSRCCAS